MKETFGIFQVEIALCQFFARLPTHPEEKSGAVIKICSEQSDVDGFQQILRRQRLIRSTTTTIMDSLSLSAIALAEDEDLGLSKSSEGSPSFLDLRDNKRESNKTPAAILRFEGLQ